MFNAIRKRLIVYYIDEIDKQWYKVKLDSSGV